MSERHQPGVACQIIDGPLFKTEDQRKHLGKVVVLVARVQGYTPLAPDFPIMFPSAICWETSPALFADTGTVLGELEVVWREENLRPLDGLEGKEGAVRAVELVQ